MTLYLLFVNSFTSNLAPSRRQKNSQTNPGWPADLMRSESINLLSTNRVSKLLVASCCIISFCPVHLAAFYCGLVVYQLSYMFTLHIFIDFNTSLADSMQSTMICDLCSSQICFRACGQLSESGSGTYHKELKPSINDLGRLTSIIPFRAFSCTTGAHLRAFARSRVSANTIIALRLACWTQTPNEAVV